MFDQTNLIRLADFQYTIQINEFYFDLTWRLRFTLCVRGKCRGREEYPLGDMTAYGAQGDSVLPRSPLERTIESQRERF